MVGHAMRPGTGVVGARLLYPDGSLQHAGVLLGVEPVAGHAFKHQLPAEADRGTGGSRITRNYSAVTAACALLRREIYHAVGGMDEKHLAVAYNDVDFCLKVAALGYRHVYCAEAELVHHESRSRGRDLGEHKLRRLAREREVMFQRWKQLLRNDPYYNPNLTRTAEDLSLRTTDFDWENDLAPRLAVIKQEHINNDSASTLEGAPVA
jgi:GT2 family glycosyltransferase